MFATLFRIWLPNNIDTASTKPVCETLTEVVWYTKIVTLASHVHVYIEFPEAVKYSLQNKLYSIMFLKTVAFILLAFLVQRAWKLSLGFGTSNVGYINRPGPCRNVAPIETGSEDIAVTSNGLAFISSGMQLSDMCSSAVDARFSQFVGRIYVFDFQNSKQDAVEVSLPKELQYNFSPHGIDLLEDSETGEILLFVVNHRKIGEFVEILSYQPESRSLSMVRSVTHELFTSLNDVLAIDRNSFLASNDAYFRSCWRILEPLLGLRWCNFIYFDGTVGQSIIENGHDFNSVALSRNGKQVYLTRPSEMKLEIYNRSKGTETLKLHQSINVGMAVDNVFSDQSTGDLWLGSHPSLALLTKHLSDIDLRAPSQVIRIQPLGPQNDPFNTYKLFSPFGDDGELVSGSSSAVHFKDKLLIGTVAHKVAYCEVQS